MSATESEKCANCGIHKKKMIGYKQIVKTEQEADDLSACFARTIVIGSVLCNKCSGSARFAKAKLPKLEDPNVSESTSGSQEVLPTESSSEPSSQQSLYEPPMQTCTEEEKIELPFKRIVSTHKYCCICGKSTGIVSIPFEARKQTFVDKGIFVPSGNRCCPDHLIKKKFYTDDLDNMKIVSHSSSITAPDLSNLLKSLSITSDRELTDRIGDFSMSDERLRVFTGLDWEQLKKLQKMMVSLRNTESRTVTQALVVFLFRLRTGNSNEQICAILGLDHPQQVSEFSTSILKSFEKDVLPTRFGLKAVNRSDLIRNHTTNLVKVLHDVSDDNLVLVADASYIRHQKSSNNEYQRKSYSGHKKVPLCKPFTICTTDGFIVDVIGPFYATQNDAKILENILDDSDSDLKRLMCEENDAFVLDRGFRDIVNRLEEKEKYRVLMPSLKQKTQKQLTAEEANKSRRVTMIRWVVEAVHGSVAQKYKFFHQQLDNRYLPHAGLYCKIVCFLINEFGKRLLSKASHSEEMLNYILSKNETENTLAVEAETKRWSRRKSQFKPLKSSELLDFPEMSESQLKQFFTGSYQLQQAVSYLAEIVDENDQLHLSYCKESTDIIKVQVRSRHINSKTYNCIIQYKPDTYDYKGILRHYCECFNGNRTIGCCSHVAAVIYYLSHARYSSRILRPAEKLSKIYDREEIVPVIEEDSEED